MKSARREEKGMLGTTPSSLMMPANTVHATKRVVSNEALPILYTIIAIRASVRRVSLNPSQHANTAKGQAQKAAHLSIGKINLSIVFSNVCHRCGELSNHTESSSTTPSQKSTTLPMFDVKHVGTTEPVGAGTAAVSEAMGREAPFVRRKFWHELESNNLACT